MMSKFLARISPNKIILVFIMLVGGALRLYGIDWDQGAHFHPDERAIIMTVEGIHWPVTAAEQSVMWGRDSSLNPRFFAYGSFPFYLLKIAGNLAGKFNPEYANYNKLNILGRFISTLFEIGTILTIYFAGKRLVSKKLGLLGAGMYTLAVLPIQLAHFFAVDTILTFFIMLVLYCGIAFVQTKQNKWIAIMSLCYGLAMATKISAVTLIMPIMMVLVGTLWRRPLILVSRILIAVGLAAAIFAISEPFAILDFALFKRQTLEQQAMTRDAFTFPFTLQYVGKIPYWHEIKNIFLWGLGPILATLCLTGLIWLTFNLFRRRQLVWLVLISYFCIYFGIVGKFAIGFMRYMLPIYPILILAGAWVLNKIDLKIRLNKLFLAGITLIIAVWPISFLHIYSVPNSRNQATAWIYNNIPTGAMIAREHWDDGLPWGGPSGNYPSLELPMYEPDTPEKWQKVNSILNQADYLIIASNRLYVPLMRMTNCSVLPPGRCYIQTAEYYRELFADQRGFKRIAEFETLPTIPLVNIPINDFSADESFTVYDHPKVMIFKKI